MAISASLDSFNASFSVIGCDDGVLSCRWCEPRLAKTSLKTHSGSLPRRWHKRQGWFPSHLCLISALVLGVGKC